MNIDLDESSSSTPTKPIAIESIWMTIFSRWPPSIKQSDVMIIMLELNIESLSWSFLSLSSLFFSLSFYLCMHFFVYSSEKKSSLEKKHTPPPLSISTFCMFVISIKTRKSISYLSNNWKSAETQMLLRWATSVDIGSSMVG